MQEEEEEQFTFLNITKSTFENNVAIMVGGAIRSDNCSINMEYSKFQNNSVLNKEIGMGGGLFLFGNSTVKISNVLFSKCHARSGGAIGTNFTKIIMSNSSVISNTGSAINLNPGDSFELTIVHFLTTRHLMLVEQFCVMVTV